MSDFDYDELDKTMQSLDGNDPQPVASEPNAEKPVPVEKPQLEPLSVPSRAPLPVLASRKSTGRFMDVVHPSSDMRPAVKPMLAVPNDNPPAIQVNDTTKDQLKPVSDVMSDPKPAREQNEDLDIEKLSNDIDKTLGLATNKVLETPFIPDVPVKKRPLGAFSSETPNSSSEEKIPDKEGTSGGDQSMDAGLDTPLPAELGSDLLSIESSTAVKDVPSEIIQTTPKDEKSPDEAEDSIPTALIPQQFHEKSSETDQKASPMYDNVQSYNKTLLHSAKNKSWLWVVWILLLIVVGAGIGVAAYYFLLPNL